MIKQPREWNLIKNIVQELTYFEQPNEAMMVLYNEIVELRVWLSLPSRSSFQVEDDSTHAYICP